MKSMYPIQIGTHWTGGLYSLGGLQDGSLQSGAYSLQPLILSQSCHLPVRKKTYRGPFNVNVDYGKKPLKAFQMLLKGSKRPFKVD